ncbi:hypothetical protein TSAR_001249 [Trichomalopsis sarcophagae]|uniref:Uncharacterized protein n=1 Tax=Trichomalopsis sarcophagae TaxID=543379 RepID=A0A232EM02_9HYME|nr:hypothetical protein TSAR_001249 [Trichomalopsis sarcophagae]
MYSIVMQMQAELDEQLANFKPIKINLLRIKENKLGASLMDTEVLRQIERSFNIYYRTCKFPVINITNAAELNQWIETSYGIDKDQIYIKIRIPCVNEKRVQFHRYKPIPILAYIEPRSRYMLVHSNSHYHASYEEIQECKHGDQLIICPVQWFTFNDQNSLREHPIDEPREYRLQHLPNKSIKKNTLTTQSRQCHIEWSRIAKNLQRMQHRVQGHEYTKISDNNEPEP